VLKSARAQLDGVCAKLSKGPERSSCDRTFRPSTDQKEI
jgi:hypothetical protein